LEVIDGVFPGGVKVDRVGQDQTREGGDAALRQQVFDPVFGLFEAPGVDCLA